MTVTQSDEGGTGTRGVTMGNGVASEIVIKDADAIEVRILGVGNDGNIGRAKKGNGEREGLDFATITAKWRHKTGMIESAVRLAWNYADDADVKRVEKRGRSLKPGCGIVITGGENHLKTWQRLVGGGKEAVESALGEGRRIDSIKDVAREKQGVGTTLD
jgi:hypothetical protein